MEKSEKSDSKGQKWKLVIGLIILITILTATETIIYQLRAHVNIADNVLILVALNLDIILLVILILLVARNLIKLYFERKRNVLGAKFRTKLILSFVGFSLIPCVLLFLVASNLITTSVDSWFTAQNEEPLRKALKVAQIYYDAELGKAFAKTRELSKIITKKSLLDTGKEDELTATIKKIQENFNLGVVKIFSSTREEIAHLENKRIPQSRFINPLSDLVAKALAGQEFSIIRKTYQGDLIDGVVPIVSKWREKDVVGALVFNIFDSNSLMEEINDIKNSYEKYKQRKILKTPVKSSYIITFLLITLLIIFSATWFGIYLAKGITVPIQKLAEGTRKVALGNWDYKVTAQANDEIGMLINSFNKMTDDLHSVHQSLKTSNQELDQRRDYIETVLENIASGVITIGREGKITTINKAAAKMLRLSKKEIGIHYQTLFNTPNLQTLYLLLYEVAKREKAVYEKEIHLSVGGIGLNLLASVSILFDKENRYMGMVSAFDDLTQLMKAQKMAAWQEVARRLAHEIKNPLTPIQLCTERLRKKFYEGAEGYKDIFEECTETIIQEVHDLKTMIDEFSQFARMPVPNFKLEDINDLLNTVISRYQQMYPNIEFKQKFSPNLPMISLDREQIKRVFINLFDNAIDAIMESNQTKKNIIIVSIYDRTTSKISIYICDNGKGISPENKAKLFVPYFSSKKEGRGLGLAIVHRIINDHNGSISVEDYHPRGTKFNLLFPVQTV